MPWQPSDLIAASDTGGWFDPENYATAFQDVAGTTPVTAAGQPLARVDAQVAAGSAAFNWAQATASVQPKSHADGIVFDGSDGLDSGVERFGRAGLFAAADESWTVAVAFTGWTTTGTLIARASATTTSRTFQIFLDGAGIQVYARGTLTQVMGHPNGDPRVVVLRWSVSGLQVWLNGVLQISGVPVGAAAQETGQRICLGARTNCTGFFAAAGQRITRAFLIDRALTDTEIDYLNRRLGEAVGLTIGTEPPAGGSTTVSRAATLSWSRQNSIAISPPLSWARTQSVTSDVGFSWSVRNAVSVALPVSWSVQRLVMSTLTLSWTRVAKVSVTQTIAWNRETAAPVGVAFGVSWSRRAPVAHALQIGWDRRKTVSAPLSVSWSRRKGVALSSAVSWLRAARASQTQQVSWSRAAAAKQVVNVVWSRVAQVSLALPVSWNVQSLGAAAAAFGVSWQRRQVVSRTLDVSWSRRNAAAIAFDVRWSVSAPVAALTDVHWSRVARVSQALPVSWNVQALGAATASFGVSWSRSARVLRALPVSWGVRQRASTALPVAWSVRGAVVRAHPVAWRSNGWAARSYLVAWRRDSQVAHRPAPRRRFFAGAPDSARKIAVPGRARIMRVE